MGRGSAARLAARPWSWTGATAVLIAAVTLLVLATFRDYGITWDEDVHNWYGVFVLNYYQGPRLAEPLSLRGGVRHDRRRGQPGLAARHL